MNPPAQSNLGAEQAELDQVVEPICQRLARRFASAFSEELAGARTVGREAEFPIVGQRGEAVDVRRLWNVLLETDDLTPEYGAGAPGHAPFIVGLAGADYNYALEVGLGT